MAKLCRKCKQNIDLEKSMLKCKGEILTRLRAVWQLLGQVKKQARFESALTALAKDIKKVLA